jgi:hypothetical protein
MGSSVAKVSQPSGTTCKPERLVLAHVPASRHEAAADGAPRAGPQPAF